MTVFCSISATFHFHLSTFILRNIISGDSLGKGESVYTLQVGMEQIALRQFAHDAEDTACAVHILDMILLRGGGHLADTGHAA